MLLSLHDPLLRSTFDAGGKDNDACGEDRRRNPHDNDTLSVAGGLARRLDLLPYA